MNSADLLDDKGLIQHDDTVRLVLAESVALEKKRIIKKCQKTIKCVSGQ